MFTKIKEHITKNLKIYATALATAFVSTVTLFIGYVFGIKQRTLEMNLTFEANPELNQHKVYSSKDVED